MTPDEIDAIRLNFNRNTLQILNVVLGLIMFGVALDLRVGDFARVLKAPRAPLIGLIAQFVLLPAFTWGLTMALDIAPSIALGMILVASCPGGNISNFMTHLAKGSTAVSVTMTAVSTAAAVLFTPFNVSFYGWANPATRVILTEVALNPFDLFLAIFLLLGLPLCVGLLVSHYAPGVANRLKKPFRFASIAFFLVFIIAAFAANFQNFLDYIGLVALVVILHNGAALATGYLGSRAALLSDADRRAVTIEVGIQNSGLGLLLIFDFFQGLGGMALVAAWWGIWHVVSGLTLASLWARRTPRAAAAGHAETASGDAE